MRIQRNCNYRQTIKKTFMLKHFVNQCHQENGFYFNGIYIGETKRNSRHSYERAIFFLNFNCIVFFFLYFFKLNVTNINSVFILIYSFIFSYSSQCSGQQAYLWVRSSLGAPYFWPCATITLRLVNRYIFICFKIFRISHF